MKKKLNPQESLEFYKKELIGKKFGRLTVLKHVGRINGNQRWECVCECGTIVTRRTEAFRIAPELLSCMCMRMEKTIKKQTKHGLSKSLEYRNWVSMLARCYKKKNGSYAKYGGRGITVCDRWKDSFENFLSDMGTRPTPEHSLDRIDNNKGYSPDNCRWATKREQSNNRTVNRLITVNGVTDTITNQCRKLGIHKNTVTQRLEAGVDADRAFSKEEFAKCELKNIRQRIEQDNLNKVS